MKTYVPKADEIKRDWVVVDAADAVLGRLSSRVAALLRGKHKPQEKTYYRHSGDPGHLKHEKAGELRDTRPERLIRYAVWGMLPKNRLGRQLLRKLKVYAGPTHPHQAQVPQPVGLEA
ncbi:MAG: ribosomal protein [Acidobacteria bacterium]|nr:ribosomal protein [Acidobacteriota bacterium]